MTRLSSIVAAALFLVACAGSQPPPPSKSQTASKPAKAPDTIAGSTATADKKGAKDTTHEFKENRSGTPGLTRGVTASAIKPTRTEAALKFTVVDKDKGPIRDIVIKLTDPKGRPYYTEETDRKGYAEVLVPVGQTYEVVYLSLGRKKIAAKLPVSNEPSQTIRLTLRYKRYVAPTGKRVGLVLAGVEFDSGKATLRDASYPKLDRVVEYMRHKKSARIEISGHTDNVGNAKRNKTLSRKRARACRKYLLSKGIDGGRVRAVGYGQERPIASNDTADGRQKNRRIEATEL